MPDTPFKAMGRENGPLDHSRPRGKGETCERCGLIIFVGEWPWCRPGKPEDHVR